MIGHVWVVFRQDVDDLAILTDDELYNYYVMNFIMISLLKVINLQRRGFRSP
jgi:hypothetical protein